MNKEQKELIKMLEKYWALKCVDGEKAMLELLKEFDEKQTNMREFINR